MKNLKVSIGVRNQGDNTANATDMGRNRFMVIYDRGGRVVSGVGFTPDAIDVIAQAPPRPTDPLLGEPWADPNPYFTERFEILYDCKNVAPSSSGAVRDNAQPYGSYILDIDLEGRDTIFDDRAEYDPDKDRAQQIQTGGLYILCASNVASRSLLITEAPKYQATGTVTLYFYD